MLSVTDQKDDVKTRSLDEAMSLLSDAAKKLRIGCGVVAVNQFDDDDDEECLSASQAFKRLMDDYEIEETLDRMYQSRRNYRDLSMMLIGAILSSEDPQTVKELREIHYRVLLILEEVHDGLRS